MDGMLIVCCRCNNVGVELDDERFEEDDCGQFPMAYPVPKGWVPDPDRDNDDDTAVVHPGCLTPSERREADAERQHVERILFGEHDVG